jgi:hypothetical protein
MLPCPVARTSAVDADGRQATINAAAIDNGPWFLTQLVWTVSTDRDRLGIVLPVPA